MLGIGKLLPHNLSRTSKFLQKSILHKVIIKTKAERALQSWKGANYCFTCMHQKSKSIQAVLFLTNINIFRLPRIISLWKQIDSLCTLDWFTKTFFWNFQSIRADLCYILINKQMLEKVFCSNIAPSLSSVNHLFYMAEYMGRDCLYQVWAMECTSGLR